MRAICLAVLLALGLLPACGGEPAQQEAYVHAVAVSLVTSAQLTRVSLSTSAGGSIDLTRDPSDASGATFAGTLVVAPGAQTITARCYSGTTVVGTSSAAVSVAAGQIANVQLTVLDSSTPAPLPDHSPVVTSLVVPAGAASPGSALSLSASAMDADGDPLTYAWTAAPTGCGTFSAAAATSTTWTAATTGVCAITFTATAKGKSDSRTANVTVGTAAGDVSVTVTYVPLPQIDSITLSSGATQLWSVARTDADATCKSVVFKQGTAYTVKVTYEPLSQGTLDLSDSCGGTLVQPVAAASSTSASGSWTPTVASGACVLTARLTSQTLVDRFPVVLIPGP
jgi:hypothetical protein